jgi:hypothetical protein
LPIVSATPSIEAPGEDTLTLPVDAARAAPCQDKPASAL